MTRASVAPVRWMVVPERRTFQDLRRTLAQGGMPPVHKRTPEDYARIAAFRTLEELLAVLEEYRRRVEAGQTCRLVEREHVRVPGKLLVELVIEGPS